MGNCLVTKLKGVVDNDNLPVFNVLKFKVAPGTFNFTFNGIGGKSKISFDNTVDNIYDGSGGSPISSPHTQIMGSDYIRINGTLTRETEFEYTPLYECTKIGFSTGILNSISGINSILYVPIKFFGLNYNSANILGDDFDILKLLKLPTIEEISIEGLTNHAVDLDSVDINSNLVNLTLSQSNTITGHLSSIVSKCPNLRILGVNQTSVVGNLNDLLGLSHLVTENDAQSQQIKSLQRNPGIVGTIESFAETLCASHTSGYVKGDFRYTSITFGQTPQTIENYTNDYIVIRFSATGCTVEDSSSTVKGTYNKSASTWTYA